MLLVWLEIFAAAWLSTSKLLEGTAQGHWGSKYIVVGMCRNNAKESEAAVTAADESMVSCQTECSCCLFEG